MFTLKRVDAFHIVWSCSSRACVVLYTALRTVRMEYPCLPCVTGIDTAAIYTDTSWFNTARLTAYFLRHIVTCERLKL
jgi:hypothetical protein